MYWNKLFFQTLLLLCLFLPLASQGQVQVIKAGIMNSSSGDTYIRLDENSSVEHGEVYGDEVLLYRLAAGENGFLDIQVDDIVALQGTLSLEEEGGGQSFTMTLNNRYISVPGNSTSYSLNQGDFLRIQRCSTEVRYFLNDAQIGSATIVDNNFPLYARLKITGALASTNGNEPFIWMKFPWVNDNCTAPPNRKSYARLQNQLDAAYMVVKDGWLRYTYTEEYAISAGVNDQLTYQVYDNNYQLVVGMTGTFQNLYGSNWQELDIESLSLYNFYIIEVKGMNKGETQYLRFKPE